MRLIVRNSTLEHIYTDNKDVFTDYRSINELNNDYIDVIWNYFLDPVNTEDEFLKQVQGFYNIVKVLLDMLSESQKLYLISIVDLFHVKLVESNVNRNFEISKFNLWLMGLAKENPNVFYINSSDFFTKDYIKQSVDFKYFLTSQIIVSPKIAKDYRGWVNGEIEKLKNLSRKKCLIIDMDNTLWHGVLGEDGPYGIQMNGDYPGNVFEWLQKQIAALVGTGVLVALCSKNNEEDVRQLWEINPYFLLKEELFAAQRINWKDKASNIIEISQELNIGLDSIVFLDDSPTERALVKSVVPEVTVPEFPTKEYKIIQFIKEVFETYFKTTTLTEEDKVKTKLYKDNANRKRFETNFIDTISFINGLQIKLKINKLNEIDLPRVIQLTQKTNQFNLTTKRYTFEQLNNLIKFGHSIYTLSVSDRFGDSGLTGVCILKKNSLDDVEIDAFLLSCRILGKKIEDVFLEFILQEIKDENLNSRVYAKYVRTSKNSQVLDFYDRNGFTLLKQNEEFKNYLIDQT